MDLDYSQAADFIAFDTETATADLSGLCQVGFVVVTDGNFVLQESILVRMLYHYFKVALVST